MRASDRPTLVSLLHSCVAASALTLATTAFAETPPPALTIARPGPAAGQPDVIKHLPAGRQELTFSGENATRTWQVPLDRIEAARTSTFQLAMLNAISLLPERSSVRISVNGALLATLPATSHDEVTTIPVKIPTGLLVPGDNSVQISVALAHRVDCSVEATYELWMQLDPTQTGFVVPADAAYPVRSLDDLAAEPLAEDGTTRLHVRLPEGASEAAIARASHLVQAVVHRARLVRPVVDSGPETGHGPGLDLVLDEGALQGDSTRNLKIVSRDEALTIGRDPATDRLVVVLSGADDADLDRQIDTLGRPPASVARPEPATLAGGSRRTLAQMGFATERFAGRHYMSAIDVTLPSDFYPANDRARLLIDGAHSAALGDNSALVFRVNGTLVSTMPLAAGRSERFQHAVVELPLRFFHPGHNKISIEGMTSTPADQQCDMSTMPRETRLMISDTSEIDFPNFARLATLPQIPAALSRNATDAGSPLQLYLPGADKGSVGAGLTVLANMAMGEKSMAAPVVHLGPPSSTDAPGILIAPADQLPVSMAANLHQITAPTSATQPSGLDEAAPASAEQPGSLAEIDTTASDPGTDPKLNIGTAVTRAEALLRSRGFFFSSDERRADALPTGPETMLVAAVAPDTTPRAIGGIVLPSFMRDPSEWLVVTAPTAGLRRLVADGQWASLGGQAVSFDVQTGELHSLQPSRVTYVLPSRLVASDLRPILGGIVSNNIRLSIAALLLLLALLGVSTHLLIRRSGHRQP